MDGLDELKIEREKIREQEEKIRKEQMLSMYLANINMNNAYENVEYFFQQQRFFFDRNGMFWFWNLEKSKYEMVDEVDLMTAISLRLKKAGHIIISGMKSKYLESFKQIGRMNIPKLPDKNWIQFKGKIFDIKTKQIFDANPEYFFCNPIDFEIGESSETPTMDKLFESWVGKEYVQTLYEIIAYSCYADYPIHSLFCLVGSGRNGKSRYLALIQKFIGKDNLCSTELDSLLDSRFESAKLFKKLACVIGETNFGTLSKTSLIKKLTGQDLIGYEFKNKLPFDDYNYAKLIISSNSLPPSTDTSDGFYRRWLILEFPNDFNEGKDILETIPEVEYNNLANKVIEILPKLISDGKFTGQGTIEQRKEKFIMASNPLPKFIQEYCDVGFDMFCKYGEFYHAYLKYLEKNKKRIVKMKAFKQLMAEEGFEIDKQTKNGDSSWFVNGVKLKNNWIQIFEGMTKMTKMTELPLHIYDNVISETSVISVIPVIDKPLFINKSQLVDDLLTFIELEKPTESVFELCRKYGLTDNEIEAFLKISKSQGLIFESRSGFLTSLK